MILGAIASHDVSGYAASVLSDSPLLYYRKSDISGTTMTDFAGSARNGTYVGSPTLGVAGHTSDGDKAVNYNGTSQYATVGAAADTALKAMSGPFTLEAMVRVSSLTGQRGIIDRYDTGFGGTSVYLWYIVSGKPTFIVRNASNADVTLTSNTTLTSGTWAHIAATYDGTNMRTYKEAVLDCTPQAATFSSHNRTPLLNIGRFIFSSGFFAGDMDEVAIYPTALSQAKLAAHVAAL